VTRSTNLGGSWATLNTGLGTVQFYAGLSSHPTNPLVFFGGAQDNGTNRRNTASKAWGQVLGGDGGWTQVDPVNPNRVFGEYQGSGNLFRSTDGGNNFSSAANGINSGDRNCFLPPYLIDATTPTRMFYATQRIYRSLDGGSNWSALSGDLTNGAGAIRALALAPSNSNVLYAATNDGKILVSTNGGSVFQTVLTGIPGWPRTTRELTVDPTDASKAYLAVSAFGTAQIRRTIDGGQNWTNLDQTLPDVPSTSSRSSPARPSTSSPARTTDSGSRRTRARPGAATEPDCRAPSWSTSCSSPRGTAWSSRRKVAAPGRRGCSSRVRVVGTPPRDFPTFAPGRSLGAP
jgi:photosystem II stability/assembly factor-like uncharacterized protein